MIMVEDCLHLFIFKEIKWNYLLMAFLLPVIGMFGVMIVRGFIPFGKVSMLYSDMYHQYYPFFKAFRQAILSGDGLLYSWDVGMGMEYLGLISYYLASPLNLLSILVPEKFLLYYFSFLVPIKLGLASLFFAFFLKDPALLSDMERISALRQASDERIIHSDTTLSLLTSAIAELGKERLHRQAYLEALFTQILIHVIRAFNKQEAAVFAPKKQEELCYQVMDYINTHIYSITTLTEIADQFRYDYTYLSKIFTRTTSQSISEYYRQRRLEVARALIHEGALTASEIAEKLQYSSIYSFSKAFKNQYGLSPRDYKKKNAK